MRITNNIITNNYLTALNQSLERQSAIQEQLTDGKAIHRPSDDPIKTIRSLRFSTNAAMNDQFTQNVNDAASWMETTDGAMSDLSNIMIRIKELTVSADGTKPPDALNAIGAEIDQLINQAVTIGNTKIGDRYVFAGQMDSTPPFERKTITDPLSAATMDAVIYSGDLNKISMIIKPGSANPNEDSVNLTGPEVFGPLEYKFGDPAGTGAVGFPTMGIFNQLISLKEELQKPNPDLSKVSNGLGNVDAAHAAQLKKHSELGARMATYEMAKNMMENNKDIIAKDISLNDDLDYPAAIIDQKTSENIYKAALSVGAKIMPLSLVDFLR